MKRESYSKQRHLHVKGGNIYKNKGVKLQTGGESEAILPPPMPQGNAEIVVDFHAPAACILALGWLEETSGTSKVAIGRDKQMTYALDARPALGPHVAPPK